ncbi:MAG TPA: MBL fold metallo-hydrolase [Solirubrobacteraceae bacterium]|jgi:glyoxylase-like metal-dependent hydrolase (beta-lactamase superfamily II)|nr:MBL fold metallo-hydrolase [Solirubrobacteraceae bacterium]
MSHATAALQPGTPVEGARVKVAYERGLHELGDGLFAYLQPDGSWGWSNAGLITGPGTSLLVDTLFDLRLTREMLEAMRPVTDPHPIAAAVNTHGDGDHCFGNQLLPAGAPIYATRAAMEEMQQVPPSLVHTLVTADLGPELAELSEFARNIFGSFSFEDIELRLPSSTFEGELGLRVGDRELEFIEVGPAHTAGDAIVHVPDAGVVFTGDILFSERTPIMWRGPVSNWLDACDRILALGARVLVPGHGPVTDDSGVRDVMRYLSHVRDEARARFEAGMDVDRAADDIDVSDFADWGAPERIVVNVDALYRDFDPGRAVTATPELLIGMARWRRRH